MDEDLLMLLKNKAIPNSENREYCKRNLHPVLKLGSATVYKAGPINFDIYDADQPDIKIFMQPQDTYIPLHYCDQVEIKIPLAGSCDVQTVNESLHLKPGNLMVCGRHMIHQTNHVDDHALVLNLLISNSLFSLNELDTIWNQQSQVSNELYRLLTDSNPHDNNYILFNFHHYQDIIGTVMKIVRCHRKMGVEAFQMMHLWIMMLLVQLVNDCAKSKSTVKTNRSAPGSLLTILLYIERHYATVTLGSMAMHLRVNPNYLSSYLKNHTGLSFIKLLHLQRINVAARYLTQTKLPIDQIAYRVGYEDPSYFYKVFHNLLKMSPNQYHIRHRNRRAMPTH